jgi:hypothetical protein
MTETTPNLVAAIIKGGLRSIAASFPGLASLGQAWNEYDGYRTKERIEELFGNLLDEFTAAEQRWGIQIDSLAARMDEFPPLLELTIDAVRTEIRREKRKKHAELLCHLVLDDGRVFDEKITLIEHLEALSLLDIDVLKLFDIADAISIRSLPWHGLSILGEDVNTRLRHLACSVSKLLARGLLLLTQTHQGVVYRSHEIDPLIARWQETHYMILPAGKDLLNALGRAS